MESINNVIMSYEPTTFLCFSITVKIEPIKIGNIKSLMLGLQNGLEKRKICPADR